MGFNSAFKGLIERMFEDKNFDVLLTVHLSIILAVDQLNVQILVL